MKHVTLSETLYDKGISFSDLRMEQAREELAQIDLEEKREMIAGRIVEAWLSYSLAHKTYEISETELGILRNRFRAVETEFQEGLRTRRDDIRLQVQLKRAEIDLLNAKTQISIQQEALETFVGANAPLTLELFPSPLRLKPSRS